MALGALDYAGIEVALQGILAAADFSSVMTPDNRVTQVRVYYEAMVNEMTLAHMPFVNVRLEKSRAQLRSIPNGYYEHITFLVDVFAFDFTSYRNATTLRDGILKICRQVVQSNRRFHTDLETSSIVGDISFKAYAHESGGHVASVTFTVVAEGYIEAT